MNLLELPIDIFRRILTMAVLDFNPSARLALTAGGVTELRVVNKFFDREITETVCASGLIHKVGSWPYMLRFLQKSILEPQKEDNYLTHALRYATEQLAMQYPIDNSTIEDQKWRISLEVSRAAIRYSGGEIYILLNDRKYEVYYGRNGGLPDRWRLDKDGNPIFSDFQQSIRQGISGSEAPEHVLCAAAYLGNIPLVERILSQGTNANAESNIFGKPLTNAALKGHLDVVRLLVSHGADIQYGVEHSPPPDRPGYLDLFEFWYGRYDHNTKMAATALEAAAVGGHEDVIRFLLQPEFEVRRSGHGYFKAITRCATGHNVDALKMMVDAADFSDVHENILHRFWNYMLACAALNGRAGNVTFLLEKGADIESHHTLWRGYTTALGLAASRGHTDTVRLLLEKGANVDGVGDLPAMRAANYGFARTMELLLDNGTLILPYCCRMLEEATTAGHYSTVKLFLDRGLHLVPGRPDNGQMCLEGAKSDGSEHLVRLFLEYGVPEYDSD